jgi:hypothetical protein
MNATGIPLGVILNFGMPEFDYLGVVHHAYMERWNSERGKMSARKQDTGAGLVRRTA